MKEIVLKVKGMACGGCENRIQNAIKNMEGIKEVIANHKEGTVTIVAKEIDINVIKEKIEDLGFDVL